MKPIRIAIASGKGGTGKTTLASNLALALAKQGQAVTYVDCDVEEPNGHIFLRPVIEQQSPVNIPVPEINESACTYCGTCSKLCAYSAILVLKEKILTFPKLCHGCGGCTLVCPEEAIKEVPRSVGVVEQGLASNSALTDANRLWHIQGRMDVGEAMAPPVIREVLRVAPNDQTVIVDAPPGTSCPVIESVKGADVVLLVTEPTPFGLNDLRLAVDMVRALGLPFAVAVNRAGIGDREVFTYCAEQNIEILLELADDRRIAESYARGHMILETLPELQEKFLALEAGLRKLATESRRPTCAPAEMEEYEPVPLPSSEVPPGNSTDIPELVVISGKGGTGKTSIVASLTALADEVVVADCDVDAADLHLVLEPKVEKRWSFHGGHGARIDTDECNGCGICAEHCRYQAIEAVNLEGRTVFQVDPVSCEGCKVCAAICPTQVITMEPTLDGTMFLSQCRHGAMMHAKLGVAKENSGKLVSQVRREAKAVASKQENQLILVDGSPGIGCPVIASITGAQMVLVVTEPTLSGLHDLKRVAELTAHFGIKAAVCVNKADIHPEMADQIASESEKMGLPVLGRVRYDPEVTRAQVRKQSVVEAGSSPAAQDIRALWERLKKFNA